MGGEKIKFPVSFSGRRCFCSQQREASRASGGGQRWAVGRASRGLAAPGVARWRWAAGRAGHKDLRAASDGRPRRRRAAEAGPPLVLAST